MLDTLGMKTHPTTEEASLFNHIIFLYRDDVDAFTDKYINRPVDVDNLEFIYNNNTLHHSIFNNRYIHERLGLETASLEITNAFSKLMRGDNVVIVFGTVAIIVIESDLSSVPYLENCVRLAVDLIRDCATDETINYDFMVSEKNIVSKIKSISRNLWAALTDIMHEARAIFVVNRNVG